MRSAFLRFTERKLSYLVFIVTGIVFFPVISWLLDRTIAHDQLLHAFIVLIFSGALIIFEGGIKLSYHGRLDSWSQNLLIASYLLLVIAVFTHNGLIILLSLSLGLGSFFWFLIGPAHGRFVFSGLAAFSLFVAIALFLPVMDWPLRTIAGKWAAAGLDLIGQNTDLRLLISPGEPRLLLFSNGQQFHVAAECNGFGMLGSCMLMTTFIILYRKLSFLKRLGLFVTSVVFGLVCNILRIMLIVLIAPTIPFSRYNLMHEAVGIVITYGGLLLLYLAIMPIRRKLEEQGRPEGKSTG